MQKKNMLLIGLILASIMLILIPSIFSGNITLPKELRYNTGNVTYTIDNTINTIVFSSNYLQVNNTRFYISSSSPVRVSNITAKTNNVFFDATCSGGKVWFNISGFTSGLQYNISRDITQIDSVLANSSGYISFNNSVWSSHSFYIILGAGFDIPTVTTNSSTNIFDTSAILNGYLVDDGGTGCNVSFLYGNTSQTILPIDTLLEYQNNSNDIVHTIGDTWTGQQFQLGGIGINGTYYLDKISIKGFREETFPSLTIGIRDGETNPDIINVTLVGSSISTTETWITATFDKYISFVSGKEYFICVRAEAGIIPGNGFEYKYLKSNYYEYGKARKSVDAGVTWSNVGSSNYDFTFKIYGHTNTSNITYDSRINLTSSFNSGDSFSNTTNKILSPGSLYFVRAYANNSFNASNFDYGDEVIFQTLPSNITTLTITNISGGFNLSWTKAIGSNYSVIRYSTSSYPSSPTSGILLFNGTKNYMEHNLSGNGGIHYYYSIWSYKDYLYDNVRYCNYSSGYDTVKSLFVDPPGVTTLDVSPVWDDNAILNGQITDDGGMSCNVSFLYDISSHSSLDGYAYTYNKTLKQNYSTGDVFSNSSETLTAGTLYFVRAYANNSFNASNFDYGDEVIFQTLPSNITTLTITNISGGFNLSWTKAIGSNYSVIRYSTSSYPSSPTSGILLFNGTKNYMEHNLSGNGGIHYYYSIWSYKDYLYDNVRYCNYSSGYDTVKSLFVDPPGVTTLDVSPVWDDNAILNGQITDDGGMSAYTRFYYDNDTHSNIFENSKTGSIGLTPTTKDDYWGQVFTVGNIGTNEKHIITDYRIKISSATSFKHAKFYLTNVTTNGVPGSKIYSTGILQYSDVNIGWNKINMSYCILKPNTNYSIYCKIYGEGNIVFIASNVNPYSGGTSIYSTGGVWSKVGAPDLYFEIKGLNINYTSINITTQYITGETFTTNTGKTLTPGTLYFVRAYANNSFNASNFDYGDEKTFLTAPSAVTNPYASYINSSAINISWINGTGSNRSLVVLNQNNIPDDVNDGTVIYNGTSNYTHYTNMISGETYYFKIFSFTNYNYNDIMYYRFGNGTLLTSADFIINCFDENNGTNLTFDVFITNETGSETYTFNNATNPHIVSSSVLPRGSKCSVIIEADKHEQRIYYLTITPYVWYVLNAYLPLEYPPEGSGSPSYDPDNESYSYLYLITVVGPQGEYTSPPIENAKIVFKRYINSTGNFELVSTLYTDANGQVEIYLTAGKLYKVTISKSGYITSQSDFIPSDIIFTHEFRIQPESSINPDTPLTFWDIIQFNATLHTNNSLSFYICDITDNIINYQVKIFEIYNLSNVIIGTINNTVNCETFWLSGINVSREYVLIIYINHSTLGYVQQQIVVEPLRTSIIDSDVIEEIIVGVIGPFELGYVVTFFLYIPVIVLLVIFGKGHPGLGIISSGLYSGFITSLITMNVIVFAPFIIAIGFILLLVKGGKLKL